MIHEKLQKNWGLIFSGTRTYMYTTKNISSKGGPLFNLQGEGGAGVFVANKFLFQPGSAACWKFQIYYMFIITANKVNYLFYAESARNYLFQKYSSPVLGDWMVPP